MNENQENLELICPSCLYVTRATRYDIKVVERLGPVLCPHCGERGLRRYRIQTIEKMKQAELASKHPIHICGSELDTEHAVYMRNVNGATELCRL